MPGWAIVVSVHAVPSSGSGAAGCSGWNVKAAVPPVSDEPGLVAGDLVAGDVAERREVGALQRHHASSHAIVSTPSCENDSVPSPGRPR